MRLAGCSQGAEAEASSACAYVHKDLYYNHHMHNLGATPWRGASGGEEGPRP